ncbi:MAG TPA: hypothetical protein PKE26_15755 [Kiritimatiellia bacterium]|nr:hypothetical protein [Saprospiraceae bacterium]HMP00551.1 hypothetical protein [Kiritimatiellia bacterium]
MIAVDTPKDRIPQNASYPIGTEALSTYLKDIPQYNTIRLKYSNDPTGHRGSLDKLLNSGEPYTILKARYFIWERASVFMKRGEHSTPSWSITVYPVSRSIKKQVVEILMNEGLTRLCAWLSRKRQETWLLQSKEMTISLNPKEPSLKYKED